MWLTLIIAADVFLAWLLTTAILPDLTLVKNILLNLGVPGGFVTLALFLPNALLVALYYMLPPLPTWNAFKTWPMWPGPFPTNGKEPRAGTQYIYAICPHGIHGEATIIHFVLNVAYLHVVPIATSLLFYVPIVREFAYLAGARPANSADIAHLLDEGKSILLLPEGLRGVLYKEQDLRVLKGHTNGDSEPRKGFIRLALTSKNHKTLRIVPVWIHGTEDMYSVYRPCVWLQRLVLKTYRYPWPILNWGSIGFWPHTSRGIKVYFGDPIDPTNKEVDEVFAEYVTAMESLRSKGLADNRNNVRTDP